MEEINEWQQIEQHTTLESSGVYHGGDRSSSSSSTPTHYEEDGNSVSDSEAATTPLDWANEGKKLLKLRFEAMRVKIVRVASKVRNCAMCAGVFWSITCVAGGAAATVVLVWLIYFGIQRRRRKVDGLNDLLRHKDELAGLSKSSSSSFVVSSVTVIFLALVFILNQFVSYISMRKLLKFVYFKVMPKSSLLSILLSLLRFSGKKTIGFDREDCC